MRWRWPLESSELGAGPARRPTGPCAPERSVRRRRRETNGLLSPYARSLPSSAPKARRPRCGRGRRRLLPYPAEPHRPREFGVVGNRREHGCAPYGFPQNFYIGNIGGGTFTYQGGLFNTGAAEYYSTTFGVWNLWGTEYNNPSNPFNWGMAQAQAAINAVANGPYWLLRPRSGAGRPFG